MFRTTFGTLEAIFLSGLDANCKIYRNSWNASVDRRNYNEAILESYTVFIRIANNQKALRKLKLFWKIFWLNLNLILLIFVSFLFVDFRYFDDLDWESFRIVPKNSINKGTFDDWFLVLEISMTEDVSEQWILYEWARSIFVGKSVLRRQTSLGLQLFSIATRLVYPVPSKLLMNFYELFYNIFLLLFL